MIKINLKASPLYIVLTMLLLSLHARAQQDLKLLFIGNSLTYTNDLPEMVEREGQRMGVTIETETLAKPNFGLEDHWNRKKTTKLIESGQFDFIIVQQGPSSQEDGRASLLAYGAKFKALCDANNAELVFFMVWPARQYDHTFDGVIRNYSEAARSTDAILCPVGKKWKEALERNPELGLYGRDGFHPSEAGTLFAAQVIAGTLIPSYRK